MFGDIIDYGEMIIITVFSMTVVFGALLVISYMLDFFKVIFAEKKFREVKIETQLNNAIVAEPIVKIENDEELVALLTAAIAAYVGKGTDKLIVKRITPVESQEPIWSKMGRIDQMRIGG